MTEDVIAGPDNSKLLLSVSYDETGPTMAIERGDIWGAIWTGCLVDQDRCPFAAHGADDRQRCTLFENSVLGNVDRSTSFNK